jgi:N4-gp56 family major capsid protein
MATQTARLAKFKGELLAHAAPVETLGITGTKRSIPKNNSETVVYRRWLPFGGVDNKWITVNNVATFADDHLTAEGVTPTADTLTATDVTVTLSEYAALYQVSNKVVDLYEDDVPAEMKKQCGERMGTVREMIRYGVLRAGTNAFYAGGTNTGTVDETLSINILRKVSRSLQANHGKEITSILAASPNFNTTPVEAGYLVFCHSDMEPAIRDLPGFKHVSEYGSRKQMPNEIGSCERFRFITSPELAAIKDVGAAVGATGLFSTTGANIDVYPCIVAAEDAWGDVVLRGMESFSPTWIAPNNPSAGDPLGQRGYIGARFYSAATILNQGWMAVIHAGTPSLT